MRVFYLQFTYAPLYSGCAIKTGRICRQLKERGVEPTVLAVRFKGLKSFEEVDGVPVHRIASLGSYPAFDRFHRAAFIINLFFYLITHCRSFDLLYTVGNDWGVFLAIGLARLFGKGTVHAFTMYGEDNAAKVRSAKLGGVKFSLLKVANKFICSSNALLKDAEEAGIPPNKLIWLQNGVDLEVFKPDPARRPELREKYRIPPAHQVLVFLGSVNRRKGVDLLIEIFNRLRQEDKQLYLIIIGSKNREECPSLDGRFINMLEEKVKQYGLEENVRFTGLIGDTDLVAEYLKLSDIFVFPTETEGSPNALLEAMASGLPSVVTLIEGITDDIIHSGENGILVPREVSAFVREISGLLRDEDRRREMGRKARQTVQRSFSFDGFVEKHLALYEEVISGKYGSKV